MEKSMSGELIIEAIIKCFKYEKVEILNTDIDHTNRSEVGVGFWGKSGSDPCHIDIEVVQEKGVGVSISDKNIVPQSNYKYLCYLFNGINFYLPYGRWVIYPDQFTFEYKDFLLAVGDGVDLLIPPFVRRFLNIWKKLHPLILKALETREDPSTLLKELLIKSATNPF